MPEPEIDTALLQSVGNPCWNSNENLIAFAEPRQASAPESCPGCASALSFELFLEEVAWKTSLSRVSTRAIAHFRKAAIVAHSCSSNARISHACVSSIIRGFAVPILAAAISRGGRSRDPGASGRSSASAQKLLHRGTVLFRRPVTRRSPLDARPPCKAPRSGHKFDRTAHQRRLRRPRDETETSCFLACLKRFESSRIEALLIGKGSDAARRA
jgi:hypothetical protein